MATYYVNGVYGGSDSNNGTSETTPWLTINKALTTIAAGDTVIVKGGCTYTENSGSGYLAITQTWASQVRFICNSKTPAKIRGTSGVRSIYLANSNISFTGFDFASSNSGNTAGVLNVAGSPANCIFRRCRFFWEHDSTLHSNYLVGLGSPTAVSNLIFEDCELWGAGEVSGIYLNLVDGVRLTRCKIKVSRHGAQTYGVRCLATCKNLYVEDCEIDGTIAVYMSAALTTATKYVFQDTKLNGRTYAGLWSGGAIGQELTLMLDHVRARSQDQGLVTQSYTNAILEGVRSTAANQCIAVPGDGAYTSTRATVHDCTALTHDSTAGHAILIGIGGVNCVVSDTLANATIGLFGIVIKGTGHHVFDSTIIGGSRNSVYFKAGSDSLVEECKLIQAVSGGYAIEIIDDVTDSTDNQVINNEIVCSAGSIIRVEANVGTGNVVDKNVYQVIANGAWGEMFGSSIASFAALQSSWTSYNTANDELSSEECVTHNEILEAIEGGSGALTEEQAAQLALTPLIKAKTDLITAGGITQTMPTVVNGQFSSALVIGDDYMDEHGRALSWTVPQPLDITLAGASCRLGFKRSVMVDGEQQSVSLVVTGTVSDAGDDNMDLVFDITSAESSTLSEGHYDWSVEYIDGDTHSMTLVRHGRKSAQWVARQTDG